VRDQFDDHLVTPENAAFLFIDYQPSQLATVRSMDPGLLLKNRPHRPLAEGVTAGG
jgi:hypothetical protein